MTPTQPQITISDAAKEAARLENNEHNTFMDKPCEKNVKFAGYYVQLAMNSAVAEKDKEIADWKHRYETRCLNAENDEKEGIEEATNELRSQLLSLEAANVKLRKLLDRIGFYCAGNELSKKQADCIAALVIQALDTPTPTPTLTKVREALLIARNRLAAHDGCSRYQLGDSCVIETCDKAIALLPTSTDERKEKE